MKNLFLTLFFIIPFLTVNGENSVTIEGPIDCQVWGAGAAGRSSYIIVVEFDDVSSGCEWLTLSTRIDSKTNGTIYFRYLDQEYASSTLCLTESECGAVCDEGAFVVNGGFNGYFEYDPVNQTKKYLIEVEWGQPDNTQIGGKLTAIYKEKNSPFEAKDNIVTALYPRKTKEIKVTPVHCDQVMLSTNLFGNPDNAPFPVSCPPTGIQFMGMPYLRSISVRFEWQRMGPNGWTPHSTTFEPKVGFNSSNPYQIHSVRVRNIVRVVLTSLSMPSAPPIIINLAYSEWSVISFRTSNKPTTITGDQLISTGESLEQFYSLDAIPTTATWTATPFYNSANTPVINPYPGSAYIFFPAVPEEELYTLTVSGNSTCGNYQLQYYVVVEENDSGNNNLISDGERWIPKSNQMKRNENPTIMNSDIMHFEKPVIDSRNETIQIQIKDEVLNKMVMVTDVNGRIHYMDKSGNSSITINTIDMPAGIYFVTVISSEGRWTEKVSVVH